MVDLTRAADPARRDAVPEWPPTYWDLFTRARATQPDHVVLADDYGRSLTVRQLHDAAEGYAAHLHDLGVRAGTVVSWQLPTTLEAMVVMAALARLGATQNPLIPMLRNREVGFITGQVGTQVLIVPEEWRGFSHGDLARELAANAGFDVLIVDHETDPTSTGGALRLPMGDGDTLPPSPPADATAVRWLYYSSGTTAEPKGARHTDPSLMAGSSGMLVLIGAGPDDVNPLVFPVSHIGGALALTTSLVSGMRFVLFDAFDPATAGERIAAHRPTMLGSAVPFFLVFMEAQRKHGDEPLYPALRACAAGGAPMPAEVNRAVRDMFGVEGIASSWGLTEFPVATSPSPDAPFAVLEHTVGPPVPDVQVRVVKADEAEAAVGEEGELRLKGPQCFLGYVDASLDADAFDRDGWFRTGDLGSVDADGNVRVSGRLKDAVIRNAENISALEVEEALYEHPSVHDVAVIGVPDPRTVERVCAVIVLEPGTTVELRDLVEHCKSLGLAAYKCPEQLEIVTELPRNPTGKLLKKDLVERFGSG